MTRLVRMDDRKPLIVKKSDLADGPLWVCRCGLSTEWPLCDDSHVTAREEDDGPVYAYARDADGALTRRDVTRDAPDTTRTRSKP